LRILIKVKPSQEIPLNISRSYIRNLIYSSIKNTEFDWMHESKYKHFCFSNFFPFDDSINYLENNRTYNLLISSPIEKLIKIVAKKTIELDILTLGKYTLRVQELKYIKTPYIIDKVITATPIVIRLPEKLYKKYDIKSKRNCEFWTNEIFLNAFIESLIKNSIKRYSHYLLNTKFGIKSNYNEEKPPLNIIRSMKFKKIVFGWDKHFRGTMWEFIIDRKWQKSSLAKYLYESGLGERNASSGSGFINLIK